MSQKIESNHPAYKSLKYQLIKLLIDIKLKEEGKGLRRAIKIPLEDFAHLLPYANVEGDREAEINKVKFELEGLADEDNETYAYKILQIVNSEIFDDFVDSFSSNKAIVLKYSRTDMESYYKESRKGDRIATERDKLIFDKDQHEFRFNGVAMEVKKSENNTRLNLCLLLSGYKNLGASNHRYTIKEFAEKFGDWSSYSDYTPGDDVELDLLKIILLGLEEHIDEPGELDDKKVLDAIIGINKRGNEKFQRKIFEYSNRVVKLLGQ